MAVFMQNTCTFYDCHLTFPSLSELIYHIEYAHIEHDPVVNEQREASQPTSIAFSYAVRFTTDSELRNYRESIANGEVQSHISQAQSSSTSNTPIDANVKQNVKHLKNTPQADQNNSAPAVHSEYSKSGFDVRRSVSECEENDGGSSSEDSDHSWNTEEYSSEFILRYGCRMSSGSAGGGTSAMDKPFGCPVPGCKKRYKNINGIKYHSKNGHKKVDQFMPSPAPFKYSKKPVTKKPPTVQDKILKRLNKKKIQMPLWQKLQKRQRHQETLDLSASRKN